MPVPNWMDEKVLTSGGRVIALSSYGASMKEALEASIQEC